MIVWQKNWQKSTTPKQQRTPFTNSGWTTAALTPQVDKDKRPYSIVMPPPNVTGQLHMGHAFDVALQDVHHPPEADAGL